MSQPSKKDTYIANGVMSADVTGTWIDCSRADLILFVAKWDNTGAPTGSFIVQGRHSSAAVSSEVFNVPIDRAIGSGFAAVTAGDTAVVVNAAGKLALFITPVFDQMRLFYDATAGAANTSLQVAVTLRRVK